MLESHQQEEYHPQTSNEKWPKRELDAELKRDKSSPKYEAIIPLLTMLRSAIEPKRRQKC